MATFRDNLHLGRKVPLWGTDDINDSAVETEKIADGAVTKDKLSSDVQETLDDAVYLNELYETINNPTREQVGESLFVDGVYITSLTKDGQVTLAFAKKDELESAVENSADAQTKYTNLLNTRLLKLGDDGLYGGTIVADNITAGTGGITGVSIKSDGTQTPSWKLKSDGDGYLANGAISWDTKGNLTFNPDAKITWSRISALEKAAETNTPKYTWVKYAKDAYGSGLSDDLTADMKYIFMAYNKDVEEESDNPADYTKVIPLSQTNAIAEVKDGKTLYTWIKYADSIDASKNYPKEIYDTPRSSTCYMGISTNNESSEESSVASDYQWIYTKGNTGATGTSVSIKGSLTSTDELASATKGEGYSYLINGYLWVYTGTTLTDETHISGFENVGQIKGDAGTSITKVTKEYLWYTKGSTPIGTETGWSEKLTEYTAGCNLWERYRYSWSDGSADTVTAPVSDQYVEKIGSKTTLIGEDGIYSGKIAADNIFAQGAYIDSACIGNLDASVITAGTLTAEIGITAEKGTIGGWEIKPTSISKQEEDGHCIIISSDVDSAISMTCDGVRHLELNALGMSLVDDEAGEDAFNVDFSTGAGSLARGKISWTADGSATFAGKITSAEGEIGGWSIAQTALKKDGTETDAGYINLDAENTALKFGTMASATEEGDATMVIDGTALSFGTPKEGVYPNYLNGTGDGSLANGHLTWDEDGNLLLSDTGSTNKITMTSKNGLVVGDSNVSPGVLGTGFRTTIKNNSIVMDGGTKALNGGLTINQNNITVDTPYISTKGETGICSAIFDGYGVKFSGYNGEGNISWKQIYDLVNGISES